MQAYTHATSASRVTPSIRPKVNLAALCRFVALLRQKAKRSLRIEDHIADRYSGCGWGDETERRLLDDVCNEGRASALR